MGYAPTTDLLALLRASPDGTVRLAQIPGLDWLAAAIARLGLVTLWVDPANAPSLNQQTTVWLKTSATSWATEGSVYLWNATDKLYEPATPALWQSLLRGVQTQAAQVDPTSDTALTGAQSGQMFTNNAAPTINYTLPLAFTAPGAVYEFVMTQPGQLNVLVANSGQPAADLLQWGTTGTRIGALSTSSGSVLRIRSINGQWFVTGSEGVWTIS